MYLYQRLKLPSPTELSEDPELAVLFALTINLAMARFALMATYPALDGPANGEQVARNEQEAYASAIVKQAHALFDIVEEYLNAVQRLRSFKSGHESSTEPAF